jgi:arabinan endo-1,5-alpha-L-arabinosidase
MVPELERDYVSRCYTVEYYMFERKSALTAPAATLPESAQKATFTNPVLDCDFPDPDVLRVDDLYYAYATNARSRNVQVARSNDLVHWTLLGDALPRLPAWATQTFGWVWAPEVTRFGDSYVMYHVVRRGTVRKGMQCIGAAISREPAGPFVAVGSGPLICQTEHGGSIDPSTFVDDDGVRYLLWKNDGNARRMATYLYIQRLADDGLSLAGEPIRLLGTDQRWEGALVEAPTLWKHEGRYYLLYSANDYRSPRYVVGYAVADSLFGPYRKANRPLLVSCKQDDLFGPGGQDIVVGPQGDAWLAFHSWKGSKYRRFNLARINWVDGNPIVVGADCAPQPMP